MSLNWAEMLLEKEATREGVAEMQLASLRDVNDILRLFYEEGWIEFGKDDLEFLLGASPRTCFKNVYEGRLVGAIFATETPEQVYYPNSRLIDRRFRKKVKYHEEGMKFVEYVRLRAKLEVIYSAARLVEKYNGLYGFQTLCDYRRFSLATDAVQLPSGQVQEVGVDNVDEIAAFAKDIYRSSRDTLLSHFLSRGARGFVSRDAAGQIEAFAMVRSLPRARALGPLLASNDAAASRVLAGAAKASPGETWQIDAHAERFPAFLAARAIPFEQEEMQVVKMYRGDESLLEDESRIYCVFSHYVS